MSEMQHMLLCWFDGSATQGACVFETGRCFRAAIPEGIPPTTSAGEYTGLLLTLLMARHLHYRHLLITGDNQSVIYQVMGKWQLRAQHLQILHTHIMRLLPTLDARIRWQPRATNLADAVLRSTEYTEVQIQGLLCRPTLLIL